MDNLDDLIKYTKDLKLLYVEDNKDARESTLLILSELFDEIVVAVDGIDGLEKFKNNEIDVVITDINMPNMDGLEMSSAIRQIDANQSIIILTAITNIAILKEAIDIGIDSFINKPLEDIDILFNKLEQIIKKINYEKAQKELEYINQTKEKTELVFKMMKIISHHWKQPLSVISTVSTGFSFKIEHDIQLTDEDFKGAKIITKKVNDLSNIFNEIEKLDLDTLDIKDIEKLVEISNPIYEN